MTFQIVAILLSGCGTKKINNNNMSNEELARRQVKISVQAIKNKDTKPIEKMFCKYVKENVPNLEKKINGLFDFIEGDIVSYGEAYIMCGSSSCTSEQGKVLEDISSGIDNIKTRSGQVYSICQSSYIVNKEHPEYEGVSELKVFNESMKKVKGDYQKKAIYCVYAQDMLKE